MTVRHDMRWMGAHGLGYGERSLNELSSKLTSADMPALIARLDGKNRSAAAGTTFGLASQCGAAIDPPYAAATGTKDSFSRYGDAREVLRQVANAARCPAQERARAHCMKQTPRP